MIVAIKGPSGAGKSWLVREYLNHARALHRCVDQCFAWQRMFPTHYRVGDGRGQTVSIIGHYERGNGGGDTLPSVTEMYRLVQDEANLGHDVLFEGKNMTDRPGRMLTLRPRELVRVIALSTSVRECVAGVNARRAARGVLEEVGGDYLETLARRHERYMVALRDTDIEVWEGDRAAATRKLKEWLG